MFVPGVSAVAHRPQTVQRRRVQTGQIAVGTTAHGRFLKLQPHFRAGCPRKFPQGDISGRPLQGRPVETAANLQRRAGERRLQVADRLLQFAGIGDGRSPDIHLGAAIGSHDVGAQSSADHANTHGQAARVVIEGRQLGHDAGHAQDGADAFLGLQPGMGRAAADDDLEVADALAGSLQCAARPGRRFQDQRPGRFGRQLLNDGPRLDAADLFVGVDQKHRCERRLQSQIAQRPQREDALGQTAFHVEAAGAAQDIAFDFQRHFGQCSQRPDGIAMSEEKLPRPALSRRVAGDEMAAGACSRRVADLIV